MSVTTRLLHSGAPVHTFCIGVWPCNNSFVTLMGGHLCQDLMEQTICSMGGSFEVRSEYITSYNSKMNLVLRRGYTRQLCCYNSATKLQAKNRTVCHRRYLLHTTQLSIRRQLCCCETSKACHLLHATIFGTTHWAICCLHCCMQQSCLVYPRL